MGFLAFVALVVATVAAIRAGKAVRANEEIVREVKGLRNQLLLDRHHRNEDRKKADARMNALSDDVAALRTHGRVDLPAPPTEDATLTVRETIKPEPRAVIDLPVQPELADVDEPTAEVSTEPAAPEPVEQVEPTPTPVSDFHGPKVSKPKPPLEQWLGVNGAAVAGTVLVAFASLLFFKISIERDWIPPGVRVVGGILTGLAGIGIAQTPRARRYAVTADGLAGAGVVILFGAFWAARVLYDMIPVELAFLLMGATTAGCVALSMRHNSRVIATLGFVGGFAAPLLLSTGSDNPVGLFGWLLVLDVAFVYLARERDWSWLASLGLLATLGYQASWIVFSMGTDRFGLGLGILLAFAAVFAVAGAGLPPERRAMWARTQAAALLVPGFFGLYFAFHADLSQNFGAIAGMILLASAGAAWVGRVDSRRGPLPSAVSIGALPVVAVWLIRNATTASDVLQASVVLVALAAVHHLAVEFDPTPERRGGPRAAATSASIGAALVALGALLLLPGDIAPWAALLGVAGGALFLGRQSMLPGRESHSAIAAAIVGVALGGRLIRNDLGSAFPDPMAWITLMVVACIGLLIWSRTHTAKLTQHAAAALPAALILALAVAPETPRIPGEVVLAGGLALAVVAAIAATLMDEGWWLALAMGVTAKLHALWGLSASAVDDTTTAMVGLGFGAVAVLLFSAWPLFGARFRTARPAWYAAALAGPLHFISLRIHWDKLVDGFDGVPAVALAAVSLGALAVLQQRWTEDHPVRKSAVVLLSAVALLFLAAAVPLQLEKSAVTVAWALQGLALLWLWRRLDHPGLKYFATGLYLLVFVRLCMNPFVLDYAPRGMRILNWVSWTYLVPAAAFVAGSRLLATLEVERALPWEVLSKTAPRVAGLLALAAVTVGFAWINLTVLDWYADGHRLSVDLARLPARDLTMSLSWVAYALALLGLGVARASAALRWVGLLLFAVTSVKVFLYDLGHLEDLYQVASIVGLGVSLILVSLVYQRFVAKTAVPDA